jgi:uncharacterized protein
MKPCSPWLPLIALLVPATLTPARAQVPQTLVAGPPSHTITVTGSADVKAVPDQAVVQLGVTTRSSTAQSAMAQNNTAMAQVVAALKQLGIPDVNIQTSSVSLNPVYNQPPPQNPSLAPQLIGFEATNTVSVQLNDLTKLGPAIDAGVAAGANQIQGISFQLSNQQPFQLTALEQAGTQARAKAQALASSLGVTLGAVDAILESSAQSIPVNAGAIAAPTVATSTPILPGQVDVHADIQVRFTLM